MASALVFVTGLTIYVRALNNRVTEPFVVTYRYYRTNGDPSRHQVLLTKVSSRGYVKTSRYASANGEISPIPETTDSSSDWTRPNYPSEPWVKFREPEFLMSRPGTSFVRRDEICGLPAYVTRLQQGGDDIEFWHSPRTGPIILKAITHLGDEGDLIMEATNVEFREVSDNEVQ